jgi:RsiW-degrading membrane proteinase PrsW (M82 family)
MFFVVGALSGLVALGLEWQFEYLANRIVDWDKITQSLAGVALRQLLEVGPIEEGCKFGSVVLLQSWNRSANEYQRFALSRPSTVFIFTIAVALGFTAEENSVYFINSTASIFDRLIGTPVHTLFAAPWGYALGIASYASIRSGRYRGVIARAWINSVICHALVNVLSIAARYSPPLSFLSYGLFPFLLWMFWRLEQLLRKVQRQPSIVIISSCTTIKRYWQMGLVLFALMLGGNTIFGLFLLVRSLSPLSLSQLFHPNVLWFIVSRFLLNLIPGIIAWRIYRYLRSSSHV